MNNYLKTRIYQMAKNSGIEISQLHLNILQFASEYYNENKVGPLYHILFKKFNISKVDIDNLFPNGLYSIFTWVGIPIQTPDQICKHIAEVEVENKREVYFDHNSTTYIRPEVEKVLLDYFSGRYGFGNPSSANKIGKEAFEQIQHARNQIAKILRCNSEEIIFTGSGSESINMAIKGIAFKNLDQKGHIISSKTEHAAVLETLKWLETIGFEVSLVDINKEGIVEVDKIKKSIKANTILICIMTVNNEIGIVNPINEIGAIAKENNIPFMTDAVQGFCKMHIHPKSCGISLMAVSGHKIYGPKGIGVLYKDNSISLSPLIHGGGQEDEMRSGTENVGYILAFAKAAQLLYNGMHSEDKRLSELQSYFIKKLDEKFDDYIINGSLKNRLSNNLNVGFKSIDSGALLLSLNHIGVYVSSGSACHEGSKEASHVIRALGTDTYNYGSIRFSFGLKTTKEEIDYLFKYLPEICMKLKEMKNKKP